jgi:hypothetical protein
MEFLSLCQTFDGQNIGAIGLDRKHRAGFHRSLIKHHRARPADTGFAADVSARQSDDIPQKMNQQKPRLDLAAMLDTVDPDRNLLFPSRVHYPFSALTLHF